MRMESIPWHLEFCMQSINIFIKNTESSLTIFYFRVSFFTANKNIQPSTSNNQPASLSSLNQPITNSQSTSDPLNVLNQPITEDPSAITDDASLPGQRGSRVPNHENDEFIVDSMKQDLDTSTSDGRPAEYLDLDQLSRDLCRPPPIYKRLIFTTAKKKLKEPIENNE